VLQQDLVPTILDYAGIKSLPFMQGRSLVKLMKEPKQPWREDVFLDSSFTMRLNPLIQAVRTKKFKYIRYFRPEKHEDMMDRKLMIFDYSGQFPDYEQLFDSTKDPEEKTNLINEPQYFEVLKKLRSRCVEMSNEQVEQRKKYMNFLKTPPLSRSEMTKINPLSW
jgi:arylsulfatase A-like enzyme